MKTDVGVMIVAAGRGARFGGSQNKVLELLHGRPVWLHAATRLRDLARVGPMVIVTAQDDEAYWLRAEVHQLLEQLGVQRVHGGKVRTESVLNGMKCLIERDVELLAIHDAARPCVTREDLQRVIQVASETGSAILARPLSGTIKRMAPSTHEISHTVDRKQLWEALTPQVFRREILVKAYERWRGRPVTDDAQLVQLAGTRSPLFRAILRT